MEWTPDGLPGFFERLRNMSAIRRFGTLPSAHPDSVANHSYDVAVLAMMIADREGDTTLSVEKILRKALWHDFEETIVSDIPHPIKHRYQGGRLGRLLEEIVETVLENEAFHELPHELAHLVSYHLYGRHGTGHGPNWKTVMITLGIAPERCHRLDTEGLEGVKNKAKFVYTCKCGTTFTLGPVRHKKVQAGSTHYCRKCRTYLRDMSFVSAGRVSHTTARQYANEVKASGATAD